MKLKSFYAVAALAVLTGLPAFAYDESANLNAAYQRGQASGTSPVTSDEQWRCAAFWRVWSEFVEDEFPAPMLANLNPALRQIPAVDASVYWESKAVAPYLNQAQLDPEVQRIVDREIDDAWFYAEGVVLYEEYAMLEILGSCALPQ